MSAEEEDSFLENPTERQWARGESIQGIAPELMGARRSDFPTNPQLPAEDTTESAALSPWLIPVASILSGPLIAALLTLLIDGRPPRAPHAVAAFSIGATAWLLNKGLVASADLWVPLEYLPTLRLLVLLAVGLLLWFLYIRAMKGRRGQDDRSLRHSALVLLLLSGLFWIGRNASWWSWLGR